jgi:hypothetical protein
MVKSSTVLETTKRTSNTEGDKVCAETILSVEQQVNVSWYGLKAPVGLEL